MMLELRRLDKLVDELSKGKAMEKILQSPVIGVGEIGNGGVSRVYWSARLVPAHNTVLQVLRDGGVIALLILTAIFFYMLLRLMRYRNSACAWVIAAGLAALGTEMISEVCHYYVYFAILPKSLRRRATIMPTSPEPKIRMSSPISIFFRFIMR